MTASRLVIWPAVTVVLAVGTAVATLAAPTLMIFVAAAIVAVIASVRYVRPALRARSGVALLLVAIALTVINLFGALTALPAGKYIPFLIAALVLLALAPIGSVDLSLPGAIAAVLCFLGIVGSLIGRVLLGNSVGVLPIVIPMLLVVLPVRFTDLSGVADSVRWARRASFGCSAIIALIGLAYARPDTVSILVLNHEKIMVVIGAVGFAILARSPTALIVSVAATGFAFVEYPAATYALVAMAAAIGVIAFVPRYTSGVSRGLLCGSIAVIYLVAAFNVEQLLRFSGAYFQTVGKTDNSATRQQIYDHVFARVGEPLFSSMFTGDLSLDVKLSGTLTRVPAHSDVLTMYLGGGIFAAVLFVAVFATSMWVVMGARPTIHPQSYRTAAILVTMAWGGLMAGLVNPILLNPTTSVIEFASLAAGVGIARSARRIEEPDVLPAPSAARASRPPVPAWERRERVRLSVGVPSGRHRRPTMPVER